MALPGAFSGIAEPAFGVDAYYPEQSADRKQHRSARLLPTRVPALATAAVMSVHWIRPLVSVGAVVVGLGISFLIIALNGEDAGEAARALYDGSFGTRQQAAATVSRALPLVLVALGWIVAFSARRINVGFEGQILAGGIAATCAALYLEGLPAPLHLAVGVVFGILGGAMYAAIAAVLWARRGVNEIVSTLLLNFVALQLFGWLIRGPWQGRGTRRAGTRLIPETARWPNLIERSPLNYDLLVVIGLVFIVAFVLRRTSFGLALRLTGANVEAARAAGVRTVRVGALSLVISGALAGLAGADLVLGGETGAVQEGFASTFGLEGIVVALLAQNQPWAVAPSALLLASLRQGGSLMEARVGIPAELLLITQGVVVLVVIASTTAVRRMRAAPIAPPPDVT
ncbi:MAG: ABC transporter permease [Acidimicrobiia bacterium]|nr:ABC transporter permease [Acidimicrobiia bacterium]